MKIYMLLMLVSVIVGFSYIPARPAGNNRAAGLATACPGVELQPFAGVHRDLRCVARLLPVAVAQTRPPPADKSSKRKTHSRPRATPRPHAGRPRLPHSAPGGIREHKARQQRERRAACLDGAHQHPDRRRRPASDAPATRDRAETGGERRQHRIEPVGAPDQRQHAGRPKQPCGGTHPSPGVRATRHARDAGHGSGDSFAPAPC